MQEGQTWPLNPLIMDIEGQNVLWGLEAIGFIPLPSTDLDFKL